MRAEVNISYLFSVASLSYFFETESPTESELMSGPHACTVSTLSMELKLINFLKCLFMIFYFWSAVWRSDDNLWESAVFFWQGQKFR